MKHIYLKQWTKELKTNNLALESIALLPELLVLQLKDSQQLCLNLSRKDSFPFLCPDRFDLAQGKALWQRLKNARIEEISLAANDRIVSIRLSHRDIYQELKHYTILAELMPPQPNVILLDGKGVILDAVQKYSYADNPRRQVLPNLPYVAPPNSFMAEESSVALPYPDGSDNCNSYFIWLYENSKKEVKSNDSLQQAVTILSKELKKLSRKLALQKQDLDMASKADYWLACAEALKPVFRQIKQGQTSITAINYLDAQLKEITIDLQADKSPQDNLQAYLKKYHKAKNGYEIIVANIAKTEAEIVETEALLDKAIKGELPQLNLDKQSSAKQIISSLNATDKLLNIKLGNEYQIVIGRKAKENDFITTQLAKPHDYWFHSRIYHGAHVLLRCFQKQTPTPELINICCNLAAGYSKARNSLNVPVDYTQVRYVRKPRKSAPGLVTYTNFKSVYATPIDARAARELLCIK